MDPTTAPSSTSRWRTTVHERGSTTRTSSSTDAPFDPLFDRLRTALERLRAARTGARGGGRHRAVDRRPGRASRRPDQRRTRRPRCSTSTAAKVRDPHVRYRWQTPSPRADGSTDVVFFGFFLSHVPRGPLRGLLGLLDGVLAPDGRSSSSMRRRSRPRQEDWIDRSGTSSSAASPTGRPPRRQGAVDVRRTSSATPEPRLGRIGPAESPLLLGDRPALKWLRMQLSVR